MSITQTPQKIRTKMSKKKKNKNRQEFNIIQLKC